MKNLLPLDTDQHYLSPLFCIGQQEQLPFTHEDVVDRLQALAVQCGFWQGPWNGPSFRRGAATWAAEVGISDAGIQTLGRWRSDAYQAYIEYSPEERINFHDASR